MIYMETSETDWKPMEKQIFRSIQRKWGKMGHQRDMGNMEIFHPRCELSLLFFLLKMDVDHQRRSSYTFWVEFYTET